MSAGAADHEPIRMDPPTTFYEGSVKLPGYGHAPNRCRGLTPVGFCTEAHIVLGRSSCGTRRCPDHWRDWSERATANMVARLGAYRHVVEGAEKRTSHVVASPPQDRRYSEDQLWRARSEAYDALRDAGVRGGAVVTHPYRTNERGDRLYAAAREQRDDLDGVGKWRFFREATEGFQDLSRYVEASPHYHTLAVGPDVEGDQAPDGWVVERIRSLGRFHIWDSASYREMVAPAYYILTHGAVPSGPGTNRATVTYFGDVHPNSFKPEEELTATEWNRIQMEAEKAVKLKPEEEGEGRRAGPEECPTEGCEADVLDIAHLGDYLADPEFKRRVKHQSGGQKLWRRLRGAFVWWDGRTDRPPPRTATSEQAMLEWLEDRGSALIPHAGQVGLPTILGDA